MKEKEILRKKFLALRKELFKNFSTEDEKSLIENFFSLKEVKNSNAILSYMSKGFETPTLNLNLEILKSKKILCLPRTDFINMNLLIKRVESLDGLELSKFGVLEPKAEAQDFNTTNIDVAIIPGIVFDKNGYRLGYGLGFYDRFLKDKKFFKIGLCFSGQILDNLPIEHHDIRLDCLISEKSILRIKK
ncbi:MAG: 5-formyltetrahydrofolate cyclo-ligase [Candidatus Micrarchaeota archaeon]|nr:5-formyltetrahydrofolate cyclo-ligase [Candidatus Micrarchaeota archaeon]